MHFPGLQFGKLHAVECRCMVSQVRHMSEEDKLRLGAQQAALLQMQVLMSVCFQNVVCWCWLYCFKQELSYHKQIARQLCPRYVEGIHWPKYYTITLKSRLRVLNVTGNGTIGQIIHDLLLVELFEVKYYRDLEMWVRGHSRSLKVVPFESLVQFPIRLP